jgi:MFS family permease
MVGGEHPFMNTAVRSQRVAGTPQALLLIVANVLPTMGIVSLIPVIPQLFAQFHDAPHAAFLVPAIITAPSVCIAALSLVAGWIADRIGRRKLLLGALLVYAFIGCAPLFLSDLNTIIATRVCLGFTEAIIITCVATLMGDYFKGAVRRKWLAWQNAAGSLMATGLIVVGGILGAFSWHGPFAMYLLAIPIFLFALRLTWEPEAAPEEVEDGTQKEANAPFPVGPMLLVYAVSFFGAIIFFIEVLQLGVVMNAIGKGSPDVIGFVTAGTGFALPVGAYLLGRLKTLRVGYVFALALAFFMVAFFLLSRSQALAGVIWGACFAQFACGITFPLLLTWAQSKLHFGVRAFGMGLWNSCFFLGQFASTMMVAFLSQTAGGISGALYWFAVVCAIALPVSIVGEALTGRSVAATHH